MLDAFDRLADERLDQQRLGFGVRNAARLEIEQQVLVEIARGRAVAALHVVGVDFELRLVVGLGVFRQQQRVRRHLGVGLLRVRPHDDLALEHAAALVVEHGLEHFAALAVRHRVIHHQRRVGMLAALEQARAADVGDRALPAEAQEQLVARDRAADVEHEGVEARMRADVGHQRGDVQRLVALARDLDVIDMRVVGDGKLQRGVRLIVAAVRAFVALDDHRARALLDHDERAGEQRGRLVAGRGEHQMDRPLDRGAGRHMDHDAVAHEGGVERDRHVVGREHLAEILRRQRIVLRQRLRHRADREAGLERREIGQFGRKHAVDEHQPPAVDVGEQRAGVLRARLRGGIGRDRERLGVAHQRAQIGVLPFLDAPVRQADRGEALERGRAQRRRARQLALRRLPFGRELLLGGVLHQGQFSHCVSYSAATGASWNCA